MPRLYRSLLIFILSLSPLASFADQFASFSSRSTQGTAWLGTSQVIRERIAITVQPDHLDVEHDLELDAQLGGSWFTPDRANSLEVIGQLTLEKGTVFTGFLLWNGETILKGKLRAKDTARRSYEDVVDRNVTNPPPPRDPALLESVGENSKGQSLYNLSVFPVTLGKSRKLRLRYLIPSAFRDSAQRCMFPHAFSRVAIVTLRGGEGLQGYALTSKRTDLRTTTLKLEQDVGTPIELEPTAYQDFQPFNAWSSSSSAYLQYVTPLFKESQGSQVYVGAVDNHRGSRGHAAHFIFRPPSKLLPDTLRTGTRIRAWIRSENDSAGKEIALDGLENTGLQDLRVFSASALQDSITWRLYEAGELKRELVEKPSLIRLQDGNQLARTFGHTAFYPMAPSMPKSLAAAWGFIDSRYALLALEQDSLSSALAREFKSSGVPPLDTGDIFPEDGSLANLPLSAWLLQRNISREELLNPTSLGKTLGWPAGIRWSIRDGVLHVDIEAAQRKAGLRVSVHDLRGKQIQSWDASALGGGSVAWKPQQGAAGTYLLRIAAGTQVWSARVVLR